MEWEGFMSHQGALMVAIFIFQPGQNIRTRYLKLGACVSFKRTLNTAPDRNRKQCVSILPVVQDAQRQHDPMTSSDVVDLIPVQ